MTKLDFTKQEIAEIKSKIYLTEEQEKVLDMWLYGKSIVETSLELHIGTTTVSNRRKEIANKISKVI